MTAFTWADNDVLLEAMLRRLDIEADDASNHQPDAGLQIAAMAQAASAVTLARLELRGQMDFERQEEEQRAAFEEQRQRNEAHQLAVDRALGEDP